MRRSGSIEVSCGLLGDESGHVSPEADVGVDVERAFQAPEIPMGHQPPAASALSAGGDPDHDVGEILIHTAGPAPGAMVREDDAAVPAGGAARALAEHADIPKGAA